MLTNEMAEQWYGYGRWDTPFWFLGPEPGGNDSNGAAVAWDRLGRGELLDCKEHHLAFNYVRWHMPPYPLQNTWKRLILLLLSFQKVDKSKEALRAYQACMWGTASGETCVIELSSIAAPSFAKSANSQSANRANRIKHVKKRIAEFNPTFIVMYSKMYLPVWETIASGVFDARGMRRTGNTITMVIPHPVARGGTDADWIQFGAMLRARCEAEGLWPGRV